MALYVMLLVFITGSVAQQDLGSKVFLFPKRTATAHVILKPEIEKPLQKVTVCLRSYTELTSDHSLFSLAMSGSGKDNTFLIFPNSPSYTAVYISQEQIKIKTDPDVLDWKFTCVTWDSDTGVVQLWVNGKLYPRRFSSKGFTINPKTSIILGQEQDSFAGGFDIKQSFSGEISDVNMWDYVLSPETMQKVSSGDHNGNLINWRSLHFEILGEVLVQPKLQCKHWAYTHNLYYQCNEDKVYN
ncbi:C-reactive protein-like [Pseudophryne corroboree]|uniref:C-reactive protein-like n=1 Tax=Pseudophryne corroboree TaxID=495146 RepID=UPI003081AEEE